MKFFTHSTKHPNKDSWFCVEATARHGGIDSGFQLFNLSDRWPSLGLSIDTVNTMGGLFSVSVHLLWWSLSFIVQHSDYSESYQYLEEREAVAQEVKAKSKSSSLGVFTNKHAALLSRIEIINDGSFPLESLPLKVKSDWQTYLGGWCALSSQDCAELVETHGEDYAKPVLLADFMVCLM